MRKYIAFLLLYSFYGFGQSGSVSGEEIKLPVLSPQSPNTSVLGKYGDVQVNESTGVIAPSIPLLEYDAGRIKLPIALNYNGNGVKVSQDPTWAGINWSLNPSGVITREVRDKIDEKTERINRVYDVTQQSLDALPLSNANGYIGNTVNTNSPWVQKLNAIGKYVSVDTEVDIFNYNFLGYSGSFYLDVDNQVHLIKYNKELSITFVYVPDYFSNNTTITNNSYFTIKTPEGDTFKFGGSNASESSRTFARSGAGSSAQSEYAQNAFYLYQISFLNGGAVNFEYDGYGGGCFNELPLQETAKIYTNTAGGFFCGKTGVTIISEIQKMVRLKKITNTINNLQVFFDSYFINECSGVYRLNNVSLQSINSGITTNLKTIYLDYFTVNTEEQASKNRFFLQKVRFFDRNNTFVNQYKLEYYNANLLPNKKSFAQDELGYFNGKTTNTTLLFDPGANINLSESFYNTLCGGLADREASLNHSQFGSLTKITYPTGGFSTFEYELPYKGKRYVYKTHNLIVKYRDPYNGIYDSTSNTTIDGEFTIYKRILYPIDNDGPLDITSSLRITGTMHIQATGPFTHQNKVGLYAIDNRGRKNLISEYKIPSSTDNTTRDFNIPFNYTLSPGSYSFSAEIHRHATAISSSIVLKTYLNLPDGERTVYYPGLRIKRVKTNDGNSSNIETIRYYYNTLRNLDKESYVFVPRYESEIRMNFDHFGTAPLQDVTILSATPVFTPQWVNGSYIYENITLSYGGDNFQKGGKSMRFLNYGERSADVYRYYTPFGQYPSTSLEYGNFVNVGSNVYSYNRSTLIEEYFFNSNLKNIKEVKYNYTATVDHLVNNVKPYLYVPQASSEFNDSHVYLLYETKSFKYRLTSTVTKELFPGLGREMVTTTTQTFAPDKVSLPSSIETTNSKNETKMTKFYYPSDVATIGNLTPEDATTIPQLTNKHNIGQVIKTESFLNNQLQETKQYSFKNWSGNILPSTIRTSLENNPLVERITYHNYNLYGNPTLVSLKDGPKTYYRYNSKQQVILKIENFDGSIDDGIAGNGPCYFQNLYPNSMVTSYDYDPITGNLIKITDPKCQTTTYEYDSFNRLKAVRDNQNNVINENTYNYRPQ